MCRRVATWSVLWSCVWSLAAMSTNPSSTPKINSTLTVSQSWRVIKMMANF